MAKDVNWIKIKNEYISTGISYRKLAEKHKVSFGTLRSRAEREQWTVLRNKQQHKISTKSAQKIANTVANNEVNRITRILSVSDLLLSRIEEAAAQLDSHIVSNKTKTKTVTYNKGNKPTREVVVEEEVKEVVAGIVDRQGLQQVAAALKNIKDTVTTAESGNGSGTLEDDPLSASLEKLAAEMEGGNAD